jgi:hypothetical protein
VDPDPKPCFCKPSFLICIYQGFLIFYLAAFTTVKTQVDTGGLMNSSNHGIEFWTVASCGSSVCIIVQPCTDLNTVCVAVGAGLVVGPEGGGGGRGQPGPGPRYLCLRHIPPRPHPKRRRQQNHHLGMVLTSLGQSYDLCLQAKKNGSVEAQLIDFLKKSSASRKRWFMMLQVDTISVRLRLQC